MAAIGYVPKLPDKTPRIEFFRATEHLSCLWRDRIHRHYEPKDIELGTLAEIKIPYDAAVAQADAVLAQEEVQLLAARLAVHARRLIVLTSRPWRPSTLGRAPPGGTSGPAPGAGAPASRRRPAVSSRAPTGALLRRPRR